MKMKDQVTSIEQSKRLIELGVPVQKASMVWRTMSTKTGRRKLQIACEEHIGWMCRNFPTQYAPAFTVADQQELLPVFIDAKGTFYLNISKCYEGWYVSYETESGAELISHRGTKLVDVLMDATEWLLSNGYKLNL